MRASSLLLLVGLAAGLPGLATGQQDPPGVDSTARYRDRWIALPYAGYAPETGFQFGAAGGWQFKISAGASDPGTRPSFLAGNLFGTTKGQWGVVGGADVVSLHSASWISVGADLGYFPVDYYGIGSGTTLNDRNRLEAHLVGGSFRVLRRVRGNLYLGPTLRGAGWFGLRWRHPERIPPTLAGGRDATNLGVGLTLLLEHRNSTTTPTRGHYLQLQYLRHLRGLGGDFGYDRVLVDGRVYLPVWGRDIVALTGYAEFNGPAVPIQAMAQLGAFSSQTIMRGVYLGRFRDRHSVVTQVDYRGHLSGRFGYVIFGAIGNVFGTPGNRLLDRVKASYGGGLRFDVNPRDPLNIRVDYTLTSFGEAGVSIGAAEAF
jgi:hypothetical protein